MTVLTQQTENGAVVGLVPWYINFVNVYILGVRYGALPLVLSMNSILFVLFFAFGVNEFVYIYSYYLKNNMKAERRREWVEWVYQILSGVSKGFLGSIVAAAFLT